MPSLYYHKQNLQRTMLALERAGDGVEALIGLGEVGLALDWRMEHETCRNHEGKYMPHCVADLQMRLVDFYLSFMPNAVEVPEQLTAQIERVISRLVDTGVIQGKRSDDEE